MIKLLIFDLDGTLLDTAENLADSVNYALSRHGFPSRTVGEYRLLSCQSLSKILETVLPEEYRTADCVSMLKVDFIEHYYSHLDEATKPFAGVAELLQKLYSEGYQLAVASNKSHAAVLLSLQRFFPDIRFRAVAGKREGHPVKPDKGVLEEIIQTVGVSKDETLYIGDSGVDVAAAYNARVDFIAVLWGLRPEKELEEAGAFCFAKTTDELSAYIHR